MYTIQTAERYSAFLYPYVQAGQRASITIYATDDYQLRIIFKSEGTQLPTGKLNGKIGIGYEHISSYPHYIDLLRSEQPISVLFASELPSFTVYAATEPVGENELRGLLET